MYDNLHGSDTKYDSESNPLSTTNEPYDVFDLSLDDNQLYSMVVKELDADVSYWNQNPWSLQETDEDNIQYWLGNQIDESLLLPHNIPYVDNRLLTGTRTIIAYVAAQLAKPNIVPSKGDDQSKRVARNMQMAVYQHAENNKINAKFRLALKNLIVRKRGILKLRFDPSVGPYGDIVTENIDPSDMVVDRFAQFGQDPNRIYQRLRCTTEELIARFPDKKDEIFNALSIKRGVQSQLAKMVTYYECWFSYWEDGLKKQGVTWFIPDTECVLGKMENPNWIAKGTLKTQKIVNLTNEPIKPYVWFNYSSLNSGRSYIDETSLFEQAKRQQDIVNKRGRQITENADYANPRVLVNGALMEESDAIKFVNKHPKTIGLLNKMTADGNINNAVQVIPATMLPSYVVETLYDARNEIDKMFGLNNVFSGEQPKNTSQTLGQDLLLRQQASSLQDDLLKVVNESMETYYTYLLQMMKVYCSDDYWILTKGKDGEYTSILFNSENIDTNVKVTIEADSTLPLDKVSQRQTALELAKLPNRIDDVSLYEMLGLPEPDKLADRVQKFKLDPLNYMKSIEQRMYNAEADADITLVIANKIPEERDNYSAEYLNHCTWFMTTNKFQKLSMDEQGRVQAFVQDVANKAATSQALQDSMLDPSGMLDTPQPQSPMNQAPPGLVDQMGQQGTPPGMNMNQSPEQGQNLPPMV